MVADGIPIGNYGVKLMDGADSQIRWSSPSKALICSRNA
jgi:hypothetical protein